MPSGWFPDLHVRIRDALMADLGNCAPRGCGEGACYEYGFCGGADSVPIGGCCDVLVVSPGSFQQVLRNSSATNCWRRWSQGFSVRFMVSWPTGVECQEEKTLAALQKLNECGATLLCAIANLKVPGLPEMGGQCSPVMWDGQLKCIAPQGGCAGWLADGLRIGS